VFDCQRERVALGGAAPPAAQALSRCMSFPVPHAGVPDARFVRVGVAAGGATQRQDPIASYRTQTNAAFGIARNVKNPARRLVYDPVRRCR